MSGYKEDIISILKHKLFYHNESIGAIYGAKKFKSRAQELYLYMHKKVLITDRLLTDNYDYIVILQENVSTANVLKALEHLDTGGIVILEVTEKQANYQDRYLRLGKYSGMAATKVQYEDRYYIVIHSGEDYGN